MDDLISRQDAIDLIQHAGKIGKLTCIDILKDLPDADAVEVIRCKECKFASMTYDGECKYCDIWFPDEAIYLDGDNFCSAAERKEE